jgi:hypothetical protein
MPHAQAMIQSLRQFDDSPITCVCDPDCYHAFAESPFVERMGNIFPVPIHVVEAECRSELPFYLERPRKSPRDFAWAMQACLPWWIMERCNEDWLIYIDSDCYAFQSFQPIIDPLPDTAHVGICPHHFPPGKENESAGRYNNGIVIWRKSPLSIEHALRWGRETLERWQPGHPRSIPHEQKLLDEWSEQLGQACVELPRGCDVGPWQFWSKEGAGQVIACDGMVRESLKTDYGGKGQDWNIQSYHFHEFRRGPGKNPVTIKGQQWNRSGYPLHPETIESVYLPYERQLAEFL